MKGRFITFEGVEGCGKSTQLERLAAHLAARGHEIAATREPGGTPISEAIRRVLLDPDNSAMHPMTELLLYQAARAQHVAERIRPALERGVVVLCDRFHDSTAAYQGAGRSLPMDALRQLHGLAADGLTPDLTLLLDLPAEAGLERARGQGRPDRLEGENLPFHQRVRDAFLDLARGEPDRITIVDATESVEEVAARIRARVDALFGT